MMKRLLLLLFCAALARCGSSVGGDDAGDDPSGDPAADMDAAHETGDEEEVDAAPDAPADPGSDAPVGELVQLGCYELEFAVNTDAAEGASILRWYGGFHLADEGMPVTNMSVDSLEFVKDGAERTMTGAALRYTDPIEELPRVQREVMGTVVLTSGELGACSGGPGLHRGSRGSDVLVRMRGTSDQGAWASECEVYGDETFITCHSGISMLARGSAYVWEDNPEPPPPTWVDISAVVSIDALADFEEVEVTSLVVSGEGTGETFEAPTPAGHADTYATPPEAMSLFYQGGGHLGDTLCPDWETGFPPSLTITYEGTAGGTMAFSGTAPANQCTTGEM
ncbi:MAG: hypothetical protein ABIJ56_16560 [Pseudomonadota bacterium]